MARKSASEIVSLYLERRKAMSKIHAAGMQLRQVYNGEHPMVTPELEKSEKAAVGNLINSGLEQHALRISSTVPNIICPPIKNTKIARDAADARRLTFQAWWHENKVPMKLRRRARYLIGYAFSPVVIRPCADGYPLWEVRDPLTSYPAPMPDDEVIPTDCIFAFKRSRKYLSEKYPDVRLPDPPRKRSATSGWGIPPAVGSIAASPDDMFDVVQYISAEQLTMVCVGMENPGEGTNVSAPIMLSDQPNLAGRPLVASPGRITLGRLMGQFDQMIGMYEAQGTLWAYHMHAVKRAIFGETWLVGRVGENPNVITPADPYQGDIGVVEGGNLENFRTDPGVQTIPAINLLERNQRLTGAIPAEFGGESPTNVRTDRRGLSVMGASVDFPIQEHQELLAWSLEEENKIAVAVAKGYWPDTPKTFVVPFGRGQVTYTPSTTFDTDMHRVTYAYAGTDSAGLVIEAGQRIAQGTLSKRSFMEIDPLVSDPDAEHDRVVIEAVEQAHVTSIQQQASNPQGGYPPEYLAELTRLLWEKNMPLYKAEQEANKWMQEKQQAMEEGATAGAEAQPGNALAGAPGTPQATIAGPSPGQTGLADLLGALRQPQSGPLGKVARGA